MAKLDMPLFGKCVQLQLRAIHNLLGPYAVILADQNGGKVALEYSDTLIYPENRTI